MIYFRRDWPGLLHPTGWIFSLWEAEQACSARAGDSITVLTRSGAWVGTINEVHDFFYSDKAQVEDKLGSIAELDAKYFASCPEAGRCFAVRGNFPTKQPAMKWPGHPMKGWHID